MIYGGKPSFTVDSIKLHAIKHNSPDVEPPSPKPLTLMRWLVLSMSAEGDTVLDCFCGSGTTPKMAKIANRHYIGIETSAEYVELANKRIND